MLKASGGGSLVVGCSLVGLTDSAVAIALRRHVSATAKFDTKIFTLHIQETVDKN